MYKMTVKEVRAELLKPNGQDRLERNPDICFEALWTLYEREDNAAACGLLSRFAKKKKLRDELNARLYDRSLLYNGLAGDDPKRRKNCARLMGALEEPRDVKKLIAAAEKETHRFVRPSILLALGMLGGDEALEFLEQYTVAPAADESEKKHEAAEREALRLALAKARPVQKRSFAGFSKPHEIELRCAKQLGAQLKEELSDLGIEVKKQWSDGVSVETDSPLGLFEARSFHEMLIPLEKNVRLDEKTVAAYAKSRLIALLGECITGEAPYRYRIECKGDFKNRAVTAKRIADALECPELLNAPSAYDAELRIEKQPDMPAGKCSLYVKLFVIPDTRFDYRVGSLPASIHPATAAGVLRLASDYLRVGARVLDPFCGSGTMLIERSFMSPCAALTGVDITPKALDVAKKNDETAATNIEFVCKDCLKFRAEKPYDEVIANMPFGNRVGTHENNERLYREFLPKLTEWLKTGGIAVLYTMEYTLLKNLLQEFSGGLELVSRSRTEAGGLTPTVFILKKV